VLESHERRSRPITDFKAYALNLLKSLSHDRAEPDHDVRRCQLPQGMPFQFLNELTATRVALPALFVEERARYHVVEADGNVARRSRRVDLIPQELARARIGRKGGKGLGRGRVELAAWSQEQDRRPLHRNRCSRIRDIGPRTRTSAATIAASDAQSTKLAASLAAELAVQDGLRVTLAKQIANRDPEVERRVAASPNVAPKPSGLSGQLEAIAALTHDNIPLLMFLIPLTIISAALELSPVWIALRFYPASYGSALAMWRFTEVTAIGERGAEALGEPKRFEDPTIVEAPLRLLAARTAYSRSIPLPRGLVM
jgi:hypothetical protein